MTDYEEIKSITSKTFHKITPSSGKDLTDIANFDLQAKIEDDERGYRELAVYGKLADIDVDFYLKCVSLANNESEIIIGLEFVEYNLQEYVEKYFPSPFGFDCLSNFSLPQMLQLSIGIRLLLATYQLNKLNLAHNDIHEGNVLISLCDYQYAIYKINGLTLTIPTFGIRVVLADFGRVTAYDVDPAWLFNMKGSCYFCDDFLEAKKLIYGGYGAAKSRTDVNTILQTILSLYEQIEIENREEFNTRPDLIREFQLR